SLAMAKVILVVDDEDGVRDVLALHLARAGYRVLTAADAFQALAQAAADPRPDAVLLDLNMPGPDGWHVLKRFPGIPVIVRTDARVGRLRGLRRLPRQARHPRGPSGRGAARPGRRTGVTQLTTATGGLHQVQHLQHPFLGGVWVG